MLVQARERYPTQPYRINVEMGERIVLPPEFIEEIRNEPNLVFEGSFVEVGVDKQVDGVLDCI